jgi:5-methylcytosine-specific restriction endonuclease McrA
MTVSLADSETDHVTPLSRGGDNSPRNLILTHSQCNREKHNKMLREHWDWRFKIGRDRVHLGNLLG